MYFVWNTLHINDTFAIQHFHVTNLLMLLQLALWIIMIIIIYCLYAW